MSATFVIMDFTLHAPFFWLALLCLPPLIFVLLLCLLPSAVRDDGRIRIGNPVLNGPGIPPHVEPITRPLVHLTRTQTDADLRALIVGLRHLPLPQTAPILRRYLTSADPELQLFAQSILQEKQESLQRRFSRLLPLAQSGPPELVASCIEAGLNLIASPLTPESEHPAILRKLYAKSERILRSDLDQPRAVFAAARFCLRTHQLDHARELHDRLPPGSPLRETLARWITHQAAIMHPPKSLAAGYRVQ